ncbi:MAG: hypothetical protein PHD33_01205, partial [Atribacterota bacterium]|nr:hypothetical protein [Atribacterota bacterium]
MLNQIGRDIFSEICKMEIIDTHEHIMSQEEVKEEVVHLFKVFENSYANLDLISAGMSPDIWEKKNLVEIWEEFKKYQPHVLLTTFVKNILYSLKELYGLNTGEIKEDNYQEISEKITDSYNSNNWYKYVLKEKANIKISMLDAFWNVENFNYDRELFIPVLRTNAFILGREYSSPFPKGKWAHSTIESISEAWGVSIDDFESYLEIIKLAIKKYKKIGCPAVKIGTAYHRSLYFEKTDKREAAVIYKKDPKRISLSEQKKLQDFMAHYIIHPATSAEMAVQIHTGTFASNGSIIENGNPEQLNNLFLEYPST